ncbi:hypothetical protein PbB2_02552 [Candidatus Phycosocius bacilliformis]|uniref:Uncharacterized protein n=1 Tax=Candidatus Phycosocius bacilliformis TaxID=1445552 RepID=A0A2P2ECS6_9PROT|nr:hypothetical protein [Candidatus Phycosocius bacilliformis]GBF58863.1 hypothetical protein PbB2_02552 [Candidatus Phycosocius bacilliformis]
MKVPTSHLILIPTDPTYVPHDDQAEAAADALETLLPAAREVSYDMFDDVRFIDAGEAFEAITCPLCGKDAHGWWPSAMDRAAENEFEDLAVVAACCGGQTNLNALIYQPAASFGCFALVATNAGVGKLAPEALVPIEAALGCAVRVVRQKI